MTQIPVVAGVLLLATATIFLPKILHPKRVDQIARWNWTRILVFLFFIPLVVIYVVSWIEMRRMSPSPLQHPLLAVLLMPIMCAYAVPDFMFWFVPSSPFIVFGVLTACLFIGLAKRYTAWGIPLAVSTVLFQWLTIGTMIVVSLARHI